MPINAMITAKYGIGSLKFAMEQVGLLGGEVRSPLRRPGADACEEIAQALRTAGLARQS